MKGVAAGFGSDNQTFRWFFEFRCYTTRDLFSEREKKIVLFEFPAVEFLTDDNSACAAGKPAQFKYIATFSCNKNSLCAAVS